MKEIKLTNTDKVALVDDCDYPYATMFRWRINSKGYAERTETFDDETKTMYLHRFIWYLHNGVPEDKYIVDHIDRNRLDDSLSNLRLATKAENAKNHSKYSTNTSGFNGVTFEKYFDERKNKNYEFWTAEWYEEGKQKHKRFDPTDEEKILAARFVDKMNLKLNGEFTGYLNFPNNILSDEEFEKLLEKKDMSGENNSFYGKKHTEEQKKKWSQERKEYWKTHTHPSLGRHHTEETKRKLSEANKGKLAGEKSPFAKKVRIKETNQTFNTVKQCAEYFNISHSAICNAIKRKSKVKGKYTIEYI